MAVMALGIMASMPEELGTLTAGIAGARVAERAGRSFVRGHLWGTEVVAVFSRWGKVAAASTATEMIIGHGVTRLVFCGIAGGLDAGLGIGDIVVATALVQHDLDARPYFPACEIPLLGVARIETDTNLSQGLAEAAERFLSEDLRGVVEGLRRKGSGLPAGLESGRRVVRGEVASGDRVIFGAAARAEVLSRVPAAVCVEMEGAAVAQVCYEHEIPFACVRTISDRADEQGHADVAPFLGGLAGEYTAGIVRRWLETRKIR